MSRSKDARDGRTISGINCDTWRASSVGTTISLFPAVSVNAPSATAKYVLPLAVPKPGVCFTTSRSLTLTYITTSGPMLELVATPVRF